MSGDGTCVQRACATDVRPQERTADSSRRDWCHVSSNGGPSHGVNGSRRVHEATLEVPVETGINVQYAPAVELFAGAGARVEGTRVRIPVMLVEAALRSAPRDWTIKPRRRHRAHRARHRPHVLRHRVGRPRRRAISRRRPARRSSGGVGAGAMNMRTMNEVYSSPTSSAATRRRPSWRWYDLPSCAYAAHTDSKLLDAKWSAEAALTAILGKLSRGTLLQGCRLPRMRPEARLRVHHLRRPPARLGVRVRGVAARR